VATEAARATDSEVTAQVEAVLDASRVLVAVSAQSLGALDDVISLSQFRVQVILASRGPLDLNTLAERMGVHASNATRTCDKLVALDLHDRSADPANRRRLFLSPSKAGIAPLESVSGQRRRLISELLLKMPERQRRQLRQVMRDFAAAGGERPISEWSGLLPGPQERS
jgi:DNA-binding MarR family transcriptional regulator